MITEDDDPIAAPRGEGSSATPVRRGVVPPRRVRASLLDELIEATLEAISSSPTPTAARGSTNKLPFPAVSPPPIPDPPLPPSVAKFKTSTSDRAALEAWLGPLDGLTKDDIVLRLNRDAGLIDKLLNDQVNAILHHPQFQKLEASWRGLEYLVEQGADANNLKIRILSVSWRDLVRDLERAIEFDQSQLFRKVYNDEFGSPGGEPFGLLLGDYEIEPAPRPGHDSDDVQALTNISRVAAAAFAPFVASVSPVMFAADQFADLQRSLNLGDSFDQPAFIKWRAFRQTEDSRFIGLTLPRILMRLPYVDYPGRNDRFRFREEVGGPDQSKYLWGNAAYAFGGVVIRAFAETGWLADIRGIEPNQIGGGVVTGLPAHAFSADRRGVSRKCSTDLIVTDAQEKELGELGFIPLCTCKRTELSAFYTTPSVQAAKKYDELAATVNARLSSMLQYMLCVSRFAHYVKVIGRDRVGSFTESEDLESLLNNWLIRYAVGSDDVSDEVKARFPLREAKVEVREHPSKPGVHLSVVHLRPHYQLDHLTASLKLVTEVAPTQSNSV